MAAQTVTGKGPGSSGKFTAKELAALAVGPCIVAAGRISSSVTQNLSPEGYGGTVTLPSPLVEGADDYVVMLTPVNATYAYVSDMIENGSGQMTGFGFVVSDESDVMYTVIKAGLKADV